jgi:hypothetical protein
MAEAQIDFRKGNYEAVVSKLQEVRTDQVYIKMDTKNLLLMTYYELNYIDSVLALIDSYKHFLSDNKYLTKIHKDTTMQLLTLLFLLFHLQKKNKKKFDCSKEQTEADDIMILK